MILRALRESANSELPSKEWYDARSLTRKEALFQREVDRNNRRLRERAASMGVG